MGKVSSEGDVQKRCHVVRYFSRKNTHMFPPPSIPRAKRGVERERETSESLCWLPAWVLPGSADPLEGLVAG